MGLGMTLREFIAAGDLACRRWEPDCKVPAGKGVYLLKWRATGSLGKLRPDEHEKRFGACVITLTFSSEVVVR